MYIEFLNNKLKRHIESESVRKKQFGAEMSKKIKLRIDALAAAESLADFWPPYSIPERCHELKGRKKGIFSMDVKHPYRLLFKPIKDKLPDDISDKYQIWQNIDEIIIVGIEDTHD